MSVRAALLATNAAYALAGCVALARGRLAYGAANLAVAALSTAYHADEGSVALHVTDVVVANLVVLVNAAWCFWPWPPSRARWAGVAVGAACGSVYAGASIAGSDPAHAAWHAAGGLGNLYVAAMMGPRWWARGRVGPERGPDRGSGSPPKLV